MDNLNLSTEKAIDEVIADACEMMLQDGSAVTELATKNKSLWENIKAFINTIVEKLKNAFKGVSESSAAAVELKNILGEWTELQKMWNEALVESFVYGENTGSVQFSRNESDIPKNKEIETADNIINGGMYENKPCIKFEKYIDGKNTVVTFVSNKHNDIGIQTVYISAKKISLSTTPSGKNPISHTSETLSGTTSNVKVTQDNKNVNIENNTQSEEYFSQEINSRSPRFILASTLMNATTSVEEQEHLKKYKEAITSIEDKEERLKITRNAIRNAIFEREAGLVVSMESVEKMKKAAKNLERSIDYWDKKLLELEATIPLKNLMERQRKSLSEKYMKKARTKLDETRARFYASNRREQIKKNANTLISWFNRPDNTHYILYV